MVVKRLLEDTGAPDDVEAPLAVDDAAADEPEGRVFTSAAETEVLLFLPAVPSLPLTALRFPALTELWLLLESTDASFDAPPQPESIC